MESRARTAKVKFYLDESKKYLRGPMCFFNEKSINWKKRLLESARGARCDVTFKFCGKSSKAKGTHHRWGDLLRSVRHIKDEVKLNFQENSESNSKKRQV